MIFKSIVRNGESEAIELGQGQHFVAIEGDDGGGSITLSHNLTRGARVGVLDGGYIVEGPCEVKAIIKDAIEPNLTFYAKSYEPE